LWLLVFGALALPSNEPLKNNHLTSKFMFFSSCFQDGCVNQVDEPQETELNAVTRTRQDKWCP
jgi:hypothetical protein